MRNRRINWRINLLYSTSIDQLEKIRSEIKQYIIDSSDFINDEDLEHVVRVVELGSSSIDIMIVAYCEPVGFVDFNLIKENLIFNIMKIVKDNGSEFAYPSTSLYVESMPDKF
jgi:MscS family membrane protein